MKNIPLQDYAYWQNRPRFDSGDWLEPGDKIDWIKGYLETSIKHPHRQLIIDALKTLGHLDNILEVGCNCGPNLKLINEKLLIDHKHLSGLDISSDAIAFARAYMPNINFQVGKLEDKLPFHDKQFTCVIADAVLMYVLPENIKKVLKEMDRVTSRTIIIVDRFHQSREGYRRGHGWARNYQVLLEDLGYFVLSKSFDRNTWPVSRNWFKFGRIWCGQKNV